MREFVRIGMVAAACLAVAACGGNPTAPGDAGIDAQDLAAEASQEDGLISPDLVETADPNRDVVRPDVTPEDDGGGAGDDGVEPDARPSDADGDVDAPADVEAVDEADVPVDTCQGPACVVCEDDGLVCTKEEHDPETGECVSTLQEGFCLIDGACWFTLQPSPENQCLFCVPSIARDAFSPTAGPPCDDGDLCTTGDTCDASGACKAGVPTECDDRNPCTLDRCDPRVGCEFTNYQSDCDDNDACTYLDHCVDRRCIGTAKNCDDNNPCTTDSCDPGLGCLNLANSDPCNDYNACTQGDTCTGKACVGAPVDCDDGNPCTVDSCAEGPAGGCVHRADFTLPCDDGNACTTGDHCARPDPLGPLVCSGYDEICDDYSPCTLDECDPATGCVFTPFVPDVNPCTDAPDPCTVDVQCRDGACKGVPRTCDDSNACTVDSCDPVSGCRHVATSGACDDGNPCTTGETCETGACRAPAGPLGRTNCNDSNDCTTDDCLPAVGCLHTPTAGTCADSHPCSITGFGTCQDGTCHSLLKDCNDDDPCTVDSCSAGGECTHRLDIGGACDDGDVCTTGESCSALGRCEGGMTQDCDDDNPCTSYICHPQMGCIHTPMPGRCDDGSVCTAYDQCEAGVCVGQPIVCEDGNYCTDNRCDATTGCYFPPNDLACDDHEWCTLDDQCVSGVCAGLSQFEEPSVKAATLGVGLSGNTGQGVNIDGSEATCAPKGKCVKGIDNAFADLCWMFNTEIGRVNADGSLALLVEAEIPADPKATFSVNLYWGERVAPAACDPTTAGCNYGVTQGELQGVCEPVHALDNARLDGARLTAGGKDYEVPVFLVFGTHHVPLALKWARIEATVKLTDGHVTSGAGALGGAVNLQSVIDAIGAIPAIDFPPPYARDVVIQWIEYYLKPDMDVDGDGTKESVSMGWPMTLVTANIVGPL